jgi:hypothetical protein
MKGALMSGGKHVAFYPALLTVLVLATSAPAWAQWGARVDGPDVFGTTKVIAAVSSASGDGLVVQCDGKDALLLAYIMPGTPSELSELSQAGTGVPIDLLVKAGNDAVRTFTAQLSRWNNKYMGVVAQGRTPELVAMVRAIGAASGRISVGVDFLGHKQSESFGADGSTAAMNTAVKDCNLDKVAKSPVP